MKGIKLIVDYSKSLDQMILAGKYDWKNPSITEKNFPLLDGLKGRIFILSGKLFIFNKKISSNDAIIEMKSLGYRPANLAELLVLGKNYPDLQKKNPIISLGSVWQNTDNRKNVPVIGFQIFKRWLYLRWFDDIWQEYYSFLGVSK